jgi:hypothetical protein
MPLENEHARGRFEGMVIQKLDGLEQKLDEMREDLIIFRQDAYERINRNSQDIARQKGWMAAIGLAAGLVGGFIKSFVFKR